MKSEIVRVTAVAAALLLYPSCREATAERLTLADLHDTHSAHAPPAAAEADEPIALPQCLKSDRGTALLAVVHAPSPQASERPDGGGATSALLRWMPPYYVFDVDPPDARAATMRGDLGTARALLLGETPYASSILGWVPADHCLVRGHRLCARLTRGSLDVYASLADVAEVLTARAEDRPARVRPFARSRPGAADGTPWPIDTVDLPLGDRTVRVYRLHFLGSHAPETDATTVTDARPLTPDQLRAVERQLRVQCMVVCDVTGSMRPWWEQVRRFLEQEFASGLLSMGVPIEVGLVVFRDVCDAESSFEFEHRDLAEGVEGLLADVAGVTIGGGGDTPEAALRAVAATLDRTSWSDSPLTRRLLFVVSDAPSHEDQGVSLEQVVAGAKRRGVAIHGLVVGDDDGPHRQQQERQFGALGAGTGGSMRTIRDFPLLLATLSEELGAERREQADTRVVLRDANDGASDVEIATTHDLSIDRVRSILQFLSSAGVAMRDRGTPQLGVGYVLPECANHALEKEVVTTMHAVRTVQFLLQCLVQDYDVGKHYRRVGPLIVPALETSRIVTNAGQPLDVFCRLRGMPLLKSGETLAVTVEQIARMSPEERARRRSALVNEVLPRIARLLHDRRHWPFENAAGTWGFLPADGL